MNTDNTKAHDVDKSDPLYQTKVSEVITRRFEEEKRKSFEREKEKMSAGKKATSNQSIPPSSSVPPTKVADNRDPEEFVKRKEIIALVGQINNSFAILEKQRVKVDSLLLKFKKLFNDDE